MPLEIMELLRKQDRGFLLDRLQKELGDCLAAVRESGCKGSVTLEIRLKPKGRTVEQVDITTAVAARIPRLESPGTIYFVTADNGLSTRDPRQPERPGEMRVVESAEEVDRKSAAAGER